MISVTDQEKALQVLQDKDAIRELFTKYCFLTDSNSVTERAELFTEDCEYNVDGEELRGRDATKVIVDHDLPEGRIRPIKHLTLNVAIEVNGDEARADSYALVIQRSPDGLSLNTIVVGRYEDVLVKQDGNWLFKIRTQYEDLALA